MDILFGRKKSPSDLVKLVKEQLGIMDKKARDEKALTKKGSEPDLEASITLMQEFNKADLPHLLLQSLARFDFEGRRLASQVFNGILQRSVSGRYLTVEYLEAQPPILITLLHGYDQPEIAMSCGSILRECIKHESLARILLFAPEFFNLFQFVELPNFDVSSDAFATFRQLLTQHKALVCEFLDQNYDKIMSSFSELLNSTNYVMKRQSLKLLGEIVLSRSNFNTMTRYIASADNLKVIMNLLRDGSKYIQFEAFHVFKVFVANPHKAQPIKDILLKNKARLISFLSTFLSEKSDDDQFLEEKQLLIDEITKLE